MNGYYVGVDPWQRVAWCDAAPSVEWSFIPRLDFPNAPADDPLTLSLDVFGGLPERWHRGLESPRAGRWLAVFEVSDAQISEALLASLTAAATAFRNAAVLSLSYTPAADAVPSVQSGLATSEEDGCLKPLTIATVPYCWRSAAALLTRCGFDAVAATAEQRRAICKRLMTLAR